MGPRKEPPPLGTGAKSTSTTTTTTTPPQPDLNAERAGLRRTPSDAPIDEPTGGSSFPEIEVERTQESQNTTEKMKMGHEFELLNRERDGASNPSSSSAGSVPVYRTYKRRWFGVAQIVLMNIIVSWDWLTFAPVSAKAATYYNVSESAINWFSTAFMFAFIPIFPVTIKILHRGPKLSVMTSAALLLLGNWIRYAGSFRNENDGGNYGVVMFGQILTGLAQPFVLAAPTRYSDMWFTTRGRVGATAMMSLANPLGAALGQLIVPELAGDQPRDVSKAVLYVSIIATVASLPSFFIPHSPPTPVAPSSKHAKPRVRDSITIVTRSLEIWLVLGPFWILVGLFNNISSLLVQMMQPYDYSEDEAGIGGGVLILVGLIAAAVMSPILDRTKAFVSTIKVLVPISAVAYLVFVWMPRADPGNIAGPYVVLAIIGACGFSLVPCALELLTEWSYPVSPEITSTVAWAGGQLLGGSFILICDALNAGPGGDPPDNLDRALVFQAVLAFLPVAMVLPLGFFGRQDKVMLRRIRSDTDLPHRPGGA